MEKNVIVVKDEGWVFFLAKGWWVVIFQKMSFFGHISFNFGLWLYYINQKPYIAQHSYSILDQFRGKMSLFGKSKHKG